MKPGIDYIGVGVGAVIINKEGKIFLAKRGKRVRNESGLWDFPGGGVEYGETLIKSLIREIDEIGWFTLSEMAKLPLTITARHGLEHLQKKFSGLTFFK